MMANELDALESENKMLQETIATSAAEANGLDEANERLREASQKLLDSMLKQQEGKLKGVKMKDHKIFFYVGLFEVALSGALVCVQKIGASIAMSLFSIVFILAAIYLRGEDN